MPSYFDSNILLSILLNDSHASKAAELWDASRDRVSSILFEVECLTVLRRSADRFQKQLGPEWLSSREEKLEQYLGDIALMNVDAEIVSIVSDISALSSCRTLDAIHLATALYFDKLAVQNFLVCTFDSRMQAICQQVGLSLAV